MSLVVTTTDVLFHVFSTNQNTVIGQRSVFSNKPHPGTGKKIEGWVWDKRTWPTKNELEAQSFAPSLWDPTFSGIDESSLQSGYGDNNDLLLLDVIDIQVSGVEVWAPKINHGYFYSKEDEWYLYSDSYQTENFTLSNTVSGQQYVDLTYDYKPTIPIQVRQYQFDKIKGRHEVSIDVRKKIDFTVSGVHTPEFIIDNKFSPPRLWLDSIYNQTIGVPVTTSGHLLDLEQLGFSDGTPNQEFSLSFSPVDNFENIEIWSWNLPSLFPVGSQQWTVISGINQFTTGNTTEVKIDYDTGKIVFGNYQLGVGAGRIPILGDKIGIHYTKSLSAFYEPKDTKDSIISYSQEANINPVASSTHRGFIQIGIDSIDPDSIVLTSNLPKINPFIIELGNNVGQLTATVKNTAGITIEGIEVTYEILSPKVGTFGATATEVTALTDSIGSATTLYNSPATILGAGIGTTNVVISGSDMIVTVPGLVNPGDLQSLFLYKVAVSDEVLGIPASGVDTYFSDYLSAQGIIEDPNGTAASRVFEEQFRANAGLLVPPSYSSLDITTGKKSIVLTTKPSGSNVIETKTGELDSTNLPLDQFSPLLPSSIVDIGTSTAPILKITYANISFPLPGIGDTRSYFAVGDAQTRIRAFVTNPRTNKKIFSNTIEMKVTIPSTLNGTFFCTNLNTLSQNTIDTLLQRVKNMDDVRDSDILATQAIASFNVDYLNERQFDFAISSSEIYIDWFRRTKKGDTQGLFTAQASSEYLTAGGSANAFGPDLLELIACGEIPLGFRLKSTGVSIASILDQITFIDPNNHLPNNYFTVESTVQTVGHQFNIGSII